MLTNAESDCNTHKNHTREAYDEPSHELFPPEILEKIFLHVDTENILACSQTCRRWRNILALKNPFLLPKVLSIVFRHLDFQSLLHSRLVCKLWKNGLDILTGNKAVALKGQTSISSRRTEHILQQWTGCRNPFPSRTVLLSFMTNSRKYGNDFKNQVSKELGIVRIYGSHIRFLNIKIITCSRGRDAMWNVVRNVTMMLPYIINVEGLSIDVSLIAGKRNSNTSCDEALPVSQLEEDFKIPVMNTLKAFRLGAWNFAAEETEWLYCQILKQSPNLEFFDPDYILGHSKFLVIYSQPETYQFPLKFLKLAVSAKKCYKLIELISSAHFRLSNLHMDVFDMEWRKHPNACSRIFHSILRFCGPFLTTLALSFYSNSKDDKFLPLQSLEDAHVVDYYDNHQGWTIKSVVNQVTNMMPTPTSNYVRNANIETLKLRGYIGPLNVLKDFKELKCFILFHYNQDVQSIFTSKASFYEHIPTLKELHMPSSEPSEHRQCQSKVFDKRYLTLYYDTYQGLTYCNDLSINSRR